MPDLTDRRKILSTMFVKKRIQPEIPEEHLTDFDEISEDLQGLPLFRVILFLDFYGQHNRLTKILTLIGFSRN